MSGEYHYFRTKQQVLDWAQFVVDNWEWTRGIAVKSELNTGTRTLAQNAAMHQHFKNVADGLNEIGIDQKIVFEHRESSILTKWTGDSIKEVVYKPIMLALTKKKSTTMLNKSEVAQIDEALDVWFAKQFPNFQYPEFPHKEALK